jgi:hypothetical protein
LSSERSSIIDKFRDDDPFKVSTILADGSIDTVIVDSTTAYVQLAVEKAISVTKGATLERVSPGGYGARNAYTLRMMSALIRVTKKYQKNIIFTTHEDREVDKEGNFLNFTMMLGGKIGSQSALQISEVWHLSEDSGKRRVMIRPGRMRKPMKTRMFDTNGAS